MNCFEQNLHHDPDFRTTNRLRDWFRTRFWVYCRLCDVAEQGPFLSHVVAEAVIAGMRREEPPKLEPHMNRLGRRRTDRIWSKKGEPRMSYQERMLRAMAALPADLFEMNPQKKGRNAIMTQAALHDLDPRDLREFMVQRLSDDPAQPFRVDA
jgi:hypothetical protein